MWSHLASQCEYFQKCLEKNPHLALIVDETASQGCEEVLPGYLCLFNFIADSSKPIKHRVLIDMCDLPRMTGSAIGTAIRNSLQNIEAYNNLLIQHNDHQTTLSFGRHCHACKCKTNTIYKCGLWEICSAAPSTNDSLFTFGWPG